MNTAQAAMNLIVDEFMMILKITEAAFMDLPCRNEVRRDEALTQTKNVLVNSRRPARGQGRACERG
jgi:hypothetical protein